VSDLVPELATLLTVGALGFRLTPWGRRLAPRGYRPTAALEEETTHSRFRKPVA
jgi:hypothetical protein